MHSPSLSSLSFGSCTVLFCWSSVHHRLLEELYPQQGHIQLIPGENSSSQHCFTSISLLVLLSSSAHPSGILPSLLLPCVSLSLVAPPKCKSQNQLFFLSPSRQLDVGGSPLWKIQKDWKLLSASSCLSLPPSTTAWLTSSLLQTTPTSLKALLVWHKVTLTMPSLKSALLVRAVSGAQHSTAQHAGKCFTYCFIQNIHKERRADTQQCKPHLPCWGLAGGCCDDKQAGTVTGCQIYYLFFV